MILKDYYGIELGSMYLLQLHPDLDSHQFLQVPELEEISRSLLSLCGVDRTGGMDGDRGDDDQWGLRHHKRASAVAAVKATQNYAHMLALSSTGELPSSRRPLTPDAGDRTLSKRQWELRCANWRKLLRAISEEPLGNDTSGFWYICLINALRRLSVPVVASRSGPLWALQDGNRLLQPFGLQLIYVTTRPLPHGRYVVWTPASSTGHFEAVLSGDTLAVIDEDGEPEDRAHENIILMFSIRLSFRQ